MKISKNIFLNKKILIYGIGKSGTSTYKFLKNKAKIYLFDDDLKLKKNSKINFINHKEISKTNFDRIILSPGIAINNCKLKKFLKKNSVKIYTDLDVFYSFFKNKSIAITGTNGKSTTAKILFDVLLDQKKDVRLVGNIGNPILSEKNITKKTIFVIETSSYQLDYSQLFSSKYAFILNISPDHIERHGNLKNYTNAKFKLVETQNKKAFSYLNGENRFINKKLKTKKFDCKIIKVYKKNYEHFFKKIKNDYFLTSNNKENLSFIFEISKKLKLNNKLLLKTLQNFKGLKYRQQIIYKKKNLTIINDSKSTSFSSSKDILKSKFNILWLVGGIFKKGDKLNLKKIDLLNVEAFIYGKNKTPFNEELKNKVKIKNFDNLNKAIKEIFKFIKKKRSIHWTILFSPCAASFDTFKNFEERGYYFNKLIKRYLNGI